MFLFAKSGSHRFYENGDNNSYISSYMNTLEKDELTALPCHMDIFSKLKIPIDNCKVADMAGRKTRRARGRRTKRR